MNIGSIVSFKVFYIKFGIILDNKGPACYKHGFVFIYISHGFNLLSIR